METFYTNRILRRGSHPLHPLLGVLTTLLLFLGGCSPSSHLSVDQLSGRFLDGTPIRFAEVEAPRFVVNFYSPTCAPCIEELPALHVLYEEAKKSGIPLYLAVEGWPETHDVPVPETAPREKIFQAIRKRMERDIETYGIRIPVVIMDENFRITPGEGGLITGTPETLLFHTQPLMLEYNFIGPLSTATTPAELRQDPRLRFAIKKVGKGI